MENEKILEGTASGAKNSSKSRASVDLVSKQEVTRTITLFKVWRPVGLPKNIDISFDKPVTVYAEDKNGENVPTEVTKINMKLSVFLHFMREGKMKHANYLYNLANARFTEEVSAGFTNSQMKFTINPYTPDDTYIDSDGIEQNYQGYGCNYDIEYIVTDKEFFTASVVAIKTAKAEK